MASVSVRRAAVVVFITLIVSARAEATINSVTVNTSRDYENAAGYTYAEITIHGSVVRADGSVGRYSVPAVIIYPQHAREGRRRRRLAQLGLLSLLSAATTEFGTFQFTLLATGNYLFDKGYTYVSIQWNKAVTEIFGPTAPDDGQPHNHLVYGSIDRSADAWEILLDAARLLKDPSAYPGSDRPARVVTVLSSGYSQGGAAQLEFLAEGLDPTRVYDGHLDPDDRARLLEARRRRPALRLLRSLQPASDERKPRARHHARVGDRYVGLPSDRARLRKERVLHSQPDQSQLAPVRDGRDLTSSRTDPAARPSEPEHGGREAHLPRRIRQLDQVDARQTPDQPPAARYFRGSVDATGAFIPMTDADGHFAGGVRLPHVESTVNGHVAGAPLGRTRRSILSGSIRSIRSCSSVARSPGSATTSSSLDTRRGTST